MADGSQQAFPFGVPACNSRLRPGEIVVDLFAGGGGGSEALRQAIGRDPDEAINHDKLALAMHAVNHPFTRHWAEDVFFTHPRRVAAGRPVGWLHASPDCTHFSQAKGGQPRNGAIRSLSWVVLWWAGTVRPRIISLENVRQIMQWGPLRAKRKAWTRKRPDQTHADWLAENKDAGRAIKLDGTVAAPGERVPLQEQHLVPDKRHRGQTWARFVGLLRGMGYAVEWRELRAHDYGAGTSRTRLFLVARCDGEPICLPEASHGPSGKPVVRAADCIDWSNQGKSIFNRGRWSWDKKAATWNWIERPLADATLRRIARGVKRFVIDAAEPFIVPATHAGGPDRAYGGPDPLPTITAAHRGEFMAIEPTLAPFLTEHANASSSGVFSAAAPLGTQCAQVKGGHFAAVAPVLIQAGHGEGTADAPRHSYGANDVQGPLGTVVASGGGQAVAAALLVGAGGPEYSGKPMSIEQPVGTVLTDNHRAVAAATLIRQFGNSDAADVTEPVPATTAGGGGKTAVVAAHLVKWRGDSDGTAVDEPVPTITSGAGATRPAGGAHAMAACAAFLEQANGGPRNESLSGHAADEPVSTIASTGSQQRLVTASLCTLRGENTGAAATDPLRTVSAGGEHHAVVEYDLSPEHEAGALRVAAFLIMHYSTGGQHSSLWASLPTITSRDRLALVTVWVKGHPYVIVDIRLRMLTPRELFTAQGFPADYIIDRTADGRKLSISKQVALVGNSVSPPPMFALIDANLPKATAAPPVPETQQRRRRGKTAQRRAA